MKNNEKGITIVSLIITIIVTIIILGMSITASVENADKSKDSVAVSELGMVCNALVQTKTKLDIIKESEDNYPGTPISAPEFNRISSILRKENIELEGQVEDYRKITPEEGMEQMGLQSTEDTYIVSFVTGEVFNYTKQNTKEGKLLYSKAYGE